MPDAQLDIITEKYLSTQDATTHDQLRAYPKLVKMQVAAVSVDADGDPVAQMTHPQDDPANPRPFWPLRGTASVNDWLWVFLIEGNGIVLGDVGGGASGGITGIVVQDDGSPEGTVATINFGSNLDVSVAGGVATITGAAGGGGGGVTIQEDGVQEGTGITTVNLGTNLDVSVSGTTATISGSSSPLLSYTDYSAGGAPAAPSAGIMREYSLSLAGNFYVPEYQTPDAFRFRGHRDRWQNAYNNTGSTIPASTVVALVGNTANGFEIEPARADSLSTMPAWGVTLSSIATGSRGWVLHTGFHANVVFDTSAMTLGDPVYVSPTTAGGITNVRPSTPGHIVQQIGIVASVTATGQVYLSGNQHFDVAGSVGGGVNLPAGGVNTPPSGSIQIGADAGNGWEYPILRVDDGTTFLMNSDRWEIGYNNTGSTIPASRLVCHNGSTANGHEIELARADSLTTMPVWGMTLYDIAPGARGYVQVEGGGIGGFTLAGGTVGAPVYLSPTTAGQTTITRPTGAGQYIHPVGFITDVASGTIWFTPSAQADPVGSGSGISQADADTRYINVTGDTMTGELKWSDKVRSDNTGAYSTSGWFDRAQFYLWRNYSAPQTPGFLRSNIFSGVTQRGATGFTERPEGITVDMRDDAGVQEQNISGATNASPIVITTATSHTYNDGERVAIWGVLGNDNANGYYYVDVLTSTTFALYTDTALTTPRAGSGAYTSGGKVSNRPILYGVSVSVFPRMSRTAMSGTSGPTVQGDDILCYGAHNTSNPPMKGTDCFYIGRNNNFTSGAPEWITAYMNDANADYAFRTTGTHVNGLRLDEATFTGQAIRIGNGDKIGARNNANSADIDLVYLSTNDEWVISEGGQNIGLWTADPNPLNTNGRVLHMSRSDAADAVEIRLQNSATSGFADINLIGKTSAGVEVRSRLYASQFQGWVGTVSPHAFYVGQNNQVRLALPIAGGLELKNTGGSTNILAVDNAGIFTLADAANLILGTTTGTKLGTAATQKLGFWNATPIVQPANTTDIKDVLETTGLMASGGAAPLNLDGGRLTAGGVAYTARASQTVASGGTIARTAGEVVLPIAHAAAISTVRMPTGSFAWEEVTVINRGSTTITFDAAATSLVAGGTGAVIAASEAAKFIWDPDYAGAGVGRWVTIGA